MLDRRTAGLLDELNLICADNTYKVIKLQELCEKLPKKLKMDGEMISQSIYHLVERNYVSLKYFEDGVLCLSVLPKGRLFKEKKDELSLAKNKKYELAWVAMLCGAVGAFLGASISTILILLII